MGRMPDRPSRTAARNASVWPRLEQAATPVIAARRDTARTLTFRFMGLQRAIRRVFAGALTLGMATAAAATGGVPPAGQVSIPGGPPARTNQARVLDIPAFPHSRIAPPRQTADAPATTVGGGAATVSGGDLFDEI